MEKLMCVPVKLPDKIPLGEGKFSQENGDEPVRFTDLLQQKTETGPAEAEGKKHFSDSGGEASKDAEKTLPDGEEILAAFQAQSAGALLWNPDADAKPSGEGAKGWTEGMTERMPVSFGTVSAFSEKERKAESRGKETSAAAADSLPEGKWVDAGEKGQPDAGAPVLPVREEEGQFSLLGRRPAGDKTETTQEGPTWEIDADGAAGWIKKAQAASDFRASETPIFAAAVPEGELSVRNPVFQKTGEVLQTGGHLATSEAMLPEDLGQALAGRLTGRPQTLEITLEPASLGKLTIRAVYEGGRASVSILASDPKTLEILNQRAADLAGILEQRTGQETIVYAQGLYQENGGQFPGGHREQGRQEEPKRQRQHRQSDSFAQQLRLGLV